MSKCQSCKADVEAMLVEKYYAAFGTCNDGHKNIYLMETAENVLRLFVFKDTFINDEDSGGEKRQIDVLREAIVKTCKDNNLPYENDSYRRRKSIRIIFKTKDLIDFEKSVEESLYKLNTYLVSHLDRNLYSMSDDYNPLLKENDEQFYKAKLLSKSIHSEMDKLSKIIEQDIISFMFYYNKNNISEFLHLLDEHRNINKPRDYYTLYHDAKEKILSLNEQIIREFIPYAFDKFKEETKKQIEQLEILAKAKQEQTNKGE